MYKEFLPQVGKISHIKELAVKNEWLKHWNICVLERTWQHHY